MNRNFRIQFLERDLRDIPKRATAQGCEINFYSPLLLFLVSQLEQAKCYKILNGTRGVNFGDTFWAITPATSNVAAYAPVRTMRAKISQSLVLVLNVKM